MRSRKRLFAIGVCVMLALLVALQYWRDPERRFQHGLSALKSGDSQRVETEIAMLENNPRYALHRSYLRGALLLREGKIELAMDELAKSQDHPDLECEALVSMGQAMYQMGSTGNAKLLWERALSVNSDTTDAHRWLGVMYYDLGAMDHALRHLQRVADLDPTDARAPRVMGLINKDYERTHLAIGHYRESLRRDPNQKDAEQVRLELAEVEVKQKEFEAALATSKLCAPSVRQQVIQAECMLNLGDAEGAQQLVTAALKESPDNFQGLLLQGQILMEAGEVKRAVDAFKKAVAAKPTDYHARFNLAQALRRSELDEEAKVHEEVADELRETWSKFSDLHVDAIDQPANVEIRCRLGELAEKLARYSLAQNWFQAALSIDPTSERALEGLKRMQTKETGRPANDAKRPVESSDSPADKS